MPRFETHSHSWFSNIRLLDSTNNPKDLILTAAKLGYKGIALTDHEALCGAVQWLKLEKELKKEEKIPAGFCCALGNEIYLTETRNSKQKYYHYILIAKDTEGFRQLCKLSSKAWYNSYFDRGLERVPTLRSELEEIVLEKPGHLIADTACLGSFTADLALQLAAAEKRQDKETIAALRGQLEEWFAWNTKLFGDDFYLEIAPSASSEQIAYNKKLKQFARVFGIKLVCGSDAHYLTAKDRFVHKAYLNSKEGEREVDDFYQYAHLMDDDEAFENVKMVFSRDEFDTICENSLEVMKKIQSYEIFHNPIIPRVEVKEYPISVPRDGRLKTHKLLNDLFTSTNKQERYWINQCWEALIKYNIADEKHIARVETEADILRTVGEKLGNCLFEYFNTFQHFIDTFWECGSIVGPGRGSAVCFLSNFLLGITQLDPLDWNLAEWRFLNKERTELPK